MRLIGLLCGMSWESSAEYYRLANQLVNDRLGGTCVPVAGSSACAIAAW
jgi:aspartate/glutamate racemase